ncbi:hypothetical protein P7H50_00040 [Enterococcus durans]|uniref:hypothetical protein n=1 Tax=Enterococcus durans TaxID=53345 RepID=UPI00288FAA73|nr:hypothetical protein [Enterococcus durans]MDT2835304.1 hypothetical protein [Enterococcus durans]
MKIKQINALLIEFLGLLSVFLLTPDVFASEEVTLPVLIQQNIKGKTINYRLSTQDENANYPAESENGLFSNSDDQSLTLHFAFFKPGNYHYTLAPVEENLIQAQEQIYDINVLVFYNKNSQLSSVMSATNSAGYKVDSIAFAGITPDKNPANQGGNIGGKTAIKMYPETGELNSQVSLFGLLLVVRVMIIGGTHQYFYQQKSKSSL